MDGAFIPAKLSVLASWTAGGFGLLTAVLTFLGIQDGYLDRIIAENSSATVWVFVGLGIGVVASLVSATTNPAVKVYSYWVIVAVAMLALLTYVIVPDFDGDPSFHAGTWAVLVATSALVLLAIVKGSRWALALPAALLIIAVIATSCGLYSAVKISVASKSLPEGLKLAPSLSRSDGAASVDVSILGSQQFYGRGLVQVSGTVVGSDVERIIGTSDYDPDETNKVDETLVFPLPFQPWETLTLSQCEQANSGDDCVPLQRRTLSPDPALFAAAVSAKLRPGRRQVLAVATATGLPASHYVKVAFVRRAGGAMTENLNVEVSPDAEGALRWTSAVPAGGPSSWRLVVRVCGIGSCRADLARAAKLRVGR